MSSISYKLLAEQFKRVLMFLLVVIAMTLLSLVLASAWSNRSQSLDETSSLSTSEEMANSADSLIPEEETRSIKDSKLYRTLMRPATKSNFYYEEQTPVVVYSKSDINDILPGEDHYLTSSEEESFSNPGQSEDFHQDETASENSMENSNWSLLPAYDEFDEEQDSGRQLSSLNTSGNPLLSLLSVPNLALKLLLGLVSIIWHAASTLRKIWIFQPFIPWTGLTMDNELKDEPRQYPDMMQWSNTTSYEDRDKRSSGADIKDTSMATSRYIKGDPLQGYYDFVVTEGSYKFWAVFQVGTALLIIYSTFAAIYYSKVNPLVGDYEYVDYLGGGRSLSAPDLDFVDMDADEIEQNDINAAAMAANSNNTGNWLNWFVQRTTYYGKMFREIARKVDANLKQLHSETVTTTTTNTTTSTSTQSRV